MRKYIYDILIQNNYNVYSQGQVDAPTSNPYIVVLMGADSRSSGNSLGMYQTVELLCYVPDTSIFQLDIFIEEIKEVLSKSKITDYYDGIATEYHDTTLKAYMKNIKIKIPHCEI